MQKSLIHPISICIVIIACLGVSSCSTPKNVNYFQTTPRDTSLNNFVTKDFDLKIQPGDLLYIGITSSNPADNALYNSPEVTPISGNVPSGGNTVGYLVDKDGNIQMYKLNNIHAAGLSRDQLKDKIQKLILDEQLLKNPVVIVRFLNHRISILGEVNKPQVVSLQNDQINVLEAIAMSGDLTQFGRRDNILVIRQTDKGKEFKRLNLMDHSVFSSPYYYLQNEDVVYVETDLKSKNKNTSQIVSWAISGASLLFLIIDRLTR